MSEAPPPAEPGESPRTSADSFGSDGMPQRRQLLVIPVVGGALILLGVIVLILFIGLRRCLLLRDGANASMPLQVVKLVSTPSAPSPTSPLAPPACETIISSGDVEVAVPLPVSLAMGDEPFPVVAVVSEQAGWTYPSDSSGSAVWICGTVVNYVMGLEPTPENEALLAGLRPGYEIKLSLSNGVELLFHFAELQEGVAASEASVFEQLRPRLTLILEREDGTWQVAMANYVSSTEPIEPSAGTMAQIGQPVRVGDAQVTVVRGHAERGGTDLRPGTMYYLVEFSVENVGGAPLDAGGFNMELQDGVGNEYLLSPAASAFGEYGSLGGQVDPGTTAQGTAGYLVPDTLAGPTLIWTFSPGLGMELRAMVSIPYAAGTEPVAGQADVNISDAFLSDNDNVLNIEGEVRNTGNGPLTVETDDISLTSSAGMSSLRSAAPPLPWVIDPGQTQIIDLQYDTPAASTALLTLLGYSFEIGGLP
jgi:hypothetical protein